MPARSLPFRPSPPTSAWSRRALLVPLAALAAGCSIESPQVPTFDTALVIPLGRQTATGIDLLEDSEYIEGDSTGIEPLAFVVRGEIDPVEVGDFLDLETPASGFSVRLGPVEVDAPVPREVDFRLRALAPQFGPLPREVLVMAVDPFVIDPVSAEAPPIDEISWARFATGRVRVEVRNDLPVPLGASESGAPLEVVVRNRADESTILAVTLEEAIPAGGSRIVEGSLAGREITTDLEIEIRGGSPGSGGNPVAISADEQGVRVTASFEDLAADSALARVPGQTVVASDAVLLADDMHLVEGEVRAGEIPLTVENSLAVAAAARLVLPSVRTEDGLPYALDLRLPAASASAPGRLEVALDLARTTIGAPGDAGTSFLPWNLEVTTISSGGDAVPVGARQAAGVSFGRGALAFDRITGSMDQRRFELAPTETSIDPPEGIDELGFQQAAIDFEIESSVGIGSDAELTLAGVPADGGSPVVLPVRFAVAPPAGPGESRTTVVRLDETNSDILALITAGARRLRLAGSLRVGAGGAQGTITRGDVIRGRYALTAPLRMRIGQIAHRTDPFRFTVDREVQERIRENVVAAQATGAARNHFPAGLTARLVFAANEEDLELDPVSHPGRVLELGPIDVAPGVVGANGLRVTEVATTPVAIALDPSEVGFFARDELYGQIVLVIDGGEADRVVEITAADFVEVSALLRFAVRIKP